MKKLFLSLVILFASIVAFAQAPTKGCGVIKFSPKVDYATGSGPAGVSTDDLDGDGKADLAVINYTSATVSVFRNTSTLNNISLAEKVDFTTGAGVLNILTNDLDKDGKIDIIVSNFSSHTVSIFKNKSKVGSISFEAKVDYATGTNPRAISLGDLNNDGKVDLAVVNAASNTVSVFTNTSTGGSISFSEKTDFATGAGPAGVSIGDLDGDKLADITVSNLNPETISVFRNTSSGGSISFAPKVDFATGSGSHSISQRDLDGDGKADLAVANRISNTVSLLKNTSSVGSISFASKVDLTTGAEPRYITTYDMDGDGKLDMVIPNYGTTTISLFVNTGSVGVVSFAPKVDYETTKGQLIISINDLDGDKSPDIAFTKNDKAGTVSVIRGKCFSVEQAAADQINEKKRALNFAFAILNANWISGGSVIILTDYVKDANNNIIGQKYLKNSFSDRYTISNEVMMTLNYYGDQLYGAYYDYGCSGPFNIRFDEFDATYNDQSQVTRLQEKAWVSYSKGVYSKKYYALSYANNQLAKVVKYEIVGSGKNSSEVATEFEYPLTEAALEWKNNHEVTISSTSFRERAKIKDPTAVASTNKYVSSVEKGKVLNIEGKNQEMKTEYVTSGNQITHTYTNTDYKSKVVIVYTNDEKNRAVSIVKSDYKEDKLIQKVETKLEYTLKEPNLPADVICNYNVGGTTNTYDGTGNLIEENNGRQFRRKNPDGTWGQWQGYRY